MCGRIRQKTSLIMGFSIAQHNSETLSYLANHGQRSMIGKFSQFVNLEVLRVVFSLF